MVKSRDGPIRPIRCRIPRNGLRIIGTTRRDIIAVARQLTGAGGAAELVLDCSVTDGCIVVASHNIGQERVTVQRRLERCRAGS